MYLCERIVISKHMDYFNMHMPLRVICKKMVEWISVNGTQWCGIGLPDINRFFAG